MLPSASGMKDDARAGEPHAAELLAWNVPSVSGAGGRLHFMVGARCADGCDLGGRELVIYDAQGVCVGNATLGREAWPGTEALYVAEVHAGAPAACGSHQWEVKAAAWDTQTPHVAGSYPVSVCVADHCDCVVTVTAVDRDTQAPLAGARVVMHPFRAVTDDNGVAKVSVAKGKYDLLVSCRGHAPVCANVEVTADLVTRVELDAEQAWVSPDEDMA
jgi:hypothetical protein